MDRSNHHQYGTGHGQAVLHRCVVLSVRQFECTIALICDLSLAFHDTILRTDSSSCSYDTLSLLQDRCGDEG